MIRIIRTRTLAALQAIRDEARPDPSASDCLGTNALNQAEAAIERLQQQQRLDDARAETAHARAETARAEGELRALRAQHLLDTEDRAALRMLLLAVRKQNRPADRVYVLFRHGALHSIHPTHSEAEGAAEAEGAPRSGWTAAAPGAAQPPASEVPWRIQALPLGATPA